MRTCDAVTSFVLRPLLSFWRCCVLRILGLVRARTGSCFFVCSSTSPRFISLLPANDVERGGFLLLTIYWAWGLDPTTPPTTTPRRRLSPEAIVVALTRRYRRTVFKGPIPSKRNRHGRSTKSGPRVPGNRRLYGSRSSVFFIAAIPASMAPEMAAAALSGRKSAIQTTLLVPSSLAETCTDAL